MSMKVTPADLAALCFRARDALDHAIAPLEGRTLAEGETIRIVLTTSVEKHQQGHLIFGHMDGLAQHV